MQIEPDDDVYSQLALLLSSTDMYLRWSRSKEGLYEIVKESFDEKEARVVLALPKRRIPLDLVALDEIAPKLEMPKEEVEAVLNGLVSKGLIFCGRMINGREGYSLLRRGYGFTQTFFWKGEKNPRARKVAEILWKMYGGMNISVMSPSEKARTATKNYRYIPVNKSIDVVGQAVYPYERMEEVIAQAQKIAVAHCPCRMRFEIMEGKNCGHPLEVCMKFDEMAEFLIKTELGREISKEEAIEVILRTEEAGLVHFVENSQSGIKHNCNCCGCACWNVHPIRKRMIPRDMIMATYFIRKTDTSLCTACATCVDICPVDAVKIDGDSASVDQEWCIGCGVCVPRCPNEAISVMRRTDVGVPVKEFEALHQEIMESEFQQF